MNSVNDNQIYEYMKNLAVTKDVYTEASLGMLEVTEIFYPSLKHAPEMFCLPLVYILSLGRGWKIVTHC